MRDLAIMSAVLAKSGNPLPYDYEVEYIETDGKSYINTEISDLNITRLVFSFEPQYNEYVGSWTEDYIGGTYADNGGGMRVRRCEDSNELCDIRFLGWGQPEINYGEFNTLDLSKGKYIINGEEFSGYATFFGDGQDSEIYVGCSNVGGSPYRKASIKVSRVQLYDANGIVFDAIPVSLKGVGYLYDKVNPQGGPLGNGLYPNAYSSGKITPGPKV